MEHVQLSGVELAARRRLLGVCYERPFIFVDIACPKK